MKVHHIGYLVRNINKAKHAFSCLGYEPTSEVTLDDYRNVWICFMQKDDWNIELVSPAGETSVVQGLVKRIRNAPYHLCYESCTFDADAAGLKENGFMQIDQSMPAPALENRRVCFFINSQIGMIELLEEKDESFRRGAPLVILALLGQDDRLFICFFCFAEWQSSLLSRRVQV